MAAGILAEEGEPPDVVRLRLRPGAVALIASDGVVSGEDEWLRKLLGDFQGGDTRALARTVLRESGERFGYSDDMTVLAVRVEERR